MTSNAEKLARELIALSERYSDRDFDRANDLLKSGALFAGAVQAALTARKIRGVKKGDDEGNRRPTKPSSSQRVTTGGADAHAQTGVDDLLSQLETTERNDLYSFVTRFQSRETLGSGPSIRMFAQQTGVDLPRTLPSRPALLRILVTRLLDLPPETRASLLREASRTDGESSLQRWSDLIVKGK